MGTLCNKDADDDKKLLGEGSVPPPLFKRSERDTPSRPLDGANSQCKGPYSLL